MTNQTAQDMVGDHRTVLKAFSRALTREEHVLTQQPDLLWQHSTTVCSGRVAMGMGSLISATSVMLSLMVRVSWGGIVAFT